MSRWVRRAYWQGSQVRDVNRSTHLMHILHSLDIIENSQTYMELAVPHDQYPRVRFAQTPTPLELMPNISKLLGGPNLYVKRDDLTGLAFGGNKVRQLEYYFGDMMKKGADTVITTGATQSNHARVTAAMACKLGLKCEVQHESRVPDRDDAYYKSGNVLLLKLMGVRLHQFPVGEDEHGADAALEVIADRVRSEGGKPYVIHLAPTHPPLGALGYVDMIGELLDQAREQDVQIDAIVTPSGSASTHGGILVGLRSRESDIPVYGICIRRSADAQEERVLDRSQAAAGLIQQRDLIVKDDVNVDDGYLGPGYGLPDEKLMEALQLAAAQEALIVDPVYSGKALAGLIGLVRQGLFRKDQNVVFVHTGGTPALFAYTGIF